jgi:hypothetical protein
MQWNIFRIAALGAALLAQAGLSVSATGSLPEALSNHASQIEAKLSFPDGATRTARLEGVGCSQSICSRTAIKGRKAHALVREWLDSLAAIKDVTTDEATFVSKNGTERRLSLVRDFRVLYLRTQSGDTEKVDLESVRSVEIIWAQR